MQDQLRDGYNLAIEERGPGSVARQKVFMTYRLSRNMKLTSIQAVFHNIVADVKDEMFEGAADIIMGRLAKAAEAVGKALEVALSDLAEKVTVVTIARE